MFLSIVLSAISGVLYYLSFPPVALNFLIWFFLLPIFFACGALRKRGEKVLCGFAAGITGFGLNLYWIFFTVRSVGENFAISLAAVLIPAIFFSLFASVFTALSEEKPVTLAATGSLLAWLGAKIPVGMPWCALYVSQAKSPVFLQITRITGPHFLTFLILFVNASLYQSIRKRKIKIMIPALAMFLFTALYGALAMKGLSASVGAEAREISVVQLNVSQDEKWDSLKANEIMSDIRRFIQSEKESRIIVFPESCLPGIVNFDEYINEFLNEISLKTRQTILLGAAFYKARKLYNSALIINGSGKDKYYFKRRLVPFGEFVPFRRFLGRFISVINELGDFTAGDKPAILETGRLRMAPLICSESVYPSLWRGGGNMRVNISNDAWYGETSAAEQHLWHGICAASSCGVPLIFANNTGPSAIINERGVLTAESPYGSAVVLRGSVYVPVRASFYAEHFDIALPALFLILIIRWAVYLKNIMGGNVDG